MMEIIKTEMKEQIEVRSQSNDYSHAISEPLNLNEMQNDDYINLSESQNGRDYKRRLSQRRAPKYRKNKPRSLKFDNCDIDIDSIDVQITSQ